LRARTSSDMAAPRSIRSRPSQRSAEAPLGKSHQYRLVRDASLRARSRYWPVMVERFSPSSP
jgi:hypothetical protein